MFGINVQEVKGGIKRVIARAKEYNHLVDFFDMLEMRQLSLDDFIYCVDNLPIDAFVIYDYHGLVKFDFEGRDEKFIKIQTLFNNIININGKHQAVLSVAGTIPENPDTLIKVCEMELDNIYGIIKKLGYNMDDKFKWYVINKIIEGKLSFEYNTFNPREQYDFIAHNITKEMLKALLLANKGIEIIDCVTDRDMVYSLVTDPEVLLKRVRVYEREYTDKHINTIELIRIKLMEKNYFNNNKEFIEKHLDMIKDDPVSLTSIFINEEIYDPKCDRCSFPELKDLAKLFLKLPRDLKLYVLRESLWSTNKTILLDILRDEDISLFEEVLVTDRDEHGRKLFTNSDFRNILRRFGNGVYFDYIRNSVWYNQSEKDRIYKRITLCTQEEFINMFK